MGSGIYIKRSIAKHGIENFSKEILFECTSKEEMYEKEKELIEEVGYFPDNQLSYNLKPGGVGGWPHFDISPMRGKTFSPEVRAKVSKLTIDAMHSPDVRERYLEANRKVNRSGTNNPMCGDTRVFISSLEKRQIIRVRQEDIKTYLDDGWELGVSTKLKYFTYEGASKGKHILILFGVDPIPLGYYRGKSGKFVTDIKIDQRYVHPSKRKFVYRGKRIRDKDKLRQVKEKLEHDFNVACSNSSTMTPA